MMPTFMSSFVAAQGVAMTTYGTTMVILFLFFFIFLFYFKYIYTG